MSAPSRGRVIAAALTVALLLGAVACGEEKDKKQAKEAATQSCPATITNTASTSLPADVPSPGTSAYDFSNQGKTQVWFFAVSGSPDQLPSLRDSYDAQLKGRGYTITHTDQERGAEAEAEFKGPHDGTTNFRPLCSGKVVLRVKLTS